jgi:hypothetical protein
LTAGRDGDRPLRSICKECTRNERSGLGEAIIIFGVGVSLCQIPNNGFINLAREFFWHEECLPYRF